MTMNMGTTDRAARALFALTIAILWMTGYISGTIALVLGLFALIFLLTSAVGFCPLYAPFGISTRRRKAGQG